MVDWDRIAELQAEVGEDGLAEVIEMFLEEVEEGIERLDRPASPAEIAETLHFLKGSAQNIGLDAFSALCRDSEIAIRNDATSRPDVAAIRSALARARGDLEAFGS